jgi:death-on-curing protein
MNDEILYISFEEVMDVYQKTIDNSGGGFAGIRDEGGIHSVIEFMQDDLYYPTFVSKLTYLVFGFCSGHYFNDGNKRIALTLGAYFLHKNKYYWAACSFMRQVEAIVYHVAASHIDKELLERIMQCVVDGSDYDEALKIDIANAMSQCELDINEED